MKKLSTFCFALSLLAFVSCSKEEIISTDKNQDSESIIIDSNPEMVEASISSIDESTGEGYQLNNNNPTVVAVKSAVDFLATEADLSMFNEAMVKTGMDAQISGNGPYTIFAPNNVAFQNFLLNNNWNSLNDVSTGTLTTIVKFHISLSGFTVEDSSNTTAVPILFNNQSLFIHTTSSPAYITLGLTQADILTSDIDVSNGNVNKINAVLSL